jgi:replicative DNA helicase
VADEHEIPNEEYEAAREVVAMPWDNDAEESLLGAMLLSVDGIRAGIQGCHAEDFWKPIHAELYSAIVSMYHLGEPIDPLTVSRLVPEVDRKQLLRLQAETPASANASAYARIIVAHSRARAAYKHAEDVREAVKDRDYERLDELAARAASVLALPVENVEARDLLDLWALAEAEQDDPSKPWVIPGCLRQHEVYAVTGSEGLGKSMYLRQIGVCCASGVHPFTGIPGLGMVRQSVLALDLQEDEVDMASELTKLRRAAQGYEEGWYHAVSQPGGIDLLSPGGQRFMEGLLAKYRPQLVLCGPVNSMFRSPEGRKRYDEDVIEELRAVLVEMMARYGFALILEGHAGNQRQHDEDWRIRGSSVWRSWPAFSHGLRQVGDGAADKGREVDVIRARHDRYRGRAWPTKLYEKPGKLPWEPSNGDYAVIMRAMGLAHLLGESTQQEFVDPLEDYEQPEVER